MQRSFSVPVTSACSAPSRPSRTNSCLNILLAFDISEDEREEAKEEKGIPTTDNSQAAIDLHGIEPTTYQNQVYKMLRSAVPLEPTDLVCCRGGSPREIILLNFQSSVLANTYFYPFAQQCRDFDDIDSQATQVFDEDTPIQQPKLKSPHHSEVLYKLIAFIKLKMDSLQSEAQLSALLKKEFERFNLALNEKSVPLEWFLKLKKGYCRHQALFGTYLLVSYIQAYAKENSTTAEDLQMKVFRYRTKLQHLVYKESRAGHSLIVFEVKDKHLYLLDPTRQGFGGTGLIVDLLNLSVTDQDKLKLLYDPFDGKLLAEEIRGFYGYKPAAANVPSLT